MSTFTCIVLMENGMINNVTPVDGEYVIVTGKAIENAGFLNHRHFEIALAAGMRQLIVDDSTEKDGVRVASKMHLEELNEKMMQAQDPRLQLASIEAKKQLAIIEEQKKAKKKLLEHEDEEVRELALQAFPFI